MIPYVFKPTAIKQLQKLERPARERILEKIDFYASQNNLLTFAKNISDSQLGSYRFRIGNYRVIFDLDIKNRRIVILAVGHRREIYR